MRKWGIATIGCGAGVVLAIILLVLGLYAMASYNSLVTTNEQIDSAWSQVENVLQRRADLIPNLVNTVKGYAAHEKEIFEDVANARSRLAGAATPAQASAANAQLGSALSRLLAIAENYPDLKANENFIRLQDELAGTENRIANERRVYNEKVRSYNTTLKRFPTNFLGRLFGFEPREYFEAEQGAEKVPKVEF
ncbi:MAG TPA: LemA family protein [Candidatus Saccharimonadales bacterium]|nr:LemA family protein [Candidatus Saccharimonadales bacterium]